MQVTTHEEEQPEHGPELPPHCHSDRDGDCDWQDCPQLKVYRTYCPFAKFWESLYEAEGKGL